MKSLDARDRFNLILSTTTDWEANGNINYEGFLKFRSEVNRMMSEIASEALCAHGPKFTDGVCMLCGRKPNERNTLPAPLSIPETIAVLRKSIGGEK